MTQKLKNPILHEFPINSPYSTPGGLSNSWTSRNQLIPDMQEHHVGLGLVCDERLRADIVEQQEKPRPNRDNGVQLCPCWVQAESCKVKSRGPEFTKGPKVTNESWKGLNRGINRDLMENWIFQFLGHFN